MKAKTVILAASMIAYSIGPALAVAAEQLTSAEEKQPPVNMFGGTAYHGEPALAITAALVKAGGGAEEFSFADALVAMLGEDLVNAEISKLTKQYGKDQVDTFISGMDMAINYSLTRVTEAGISLPEPADLSGPALAKQLVKAGTAPDGTFWSGYLFDRAISHQLHNQVMADINASAGYDADKTTHKLLNQAMYDVAQILGLTDVKLAELH